MATALIVAAMLRIPGLGRDGLWGDECQTAVFARSSVAELVERLLPDVQAPFYYVLVGAACRIVGWDEGSLRLVSLLCGMAAVAATGWLGWRLLGPGVGGLAALLFAVNPMAVHYSREARNYSLLMLLIAMFGLVALTPVTRFTWQRVAAVSILALALVLTHNLGAFMAAGIALASLLFARKRGPSLLVWLVSGGLTGLLASPWLIGLARQVRTVGTTYSWAAPSWAAMFPWQVPRSLAAMAFGSPPPVRNAVYDVDLAAICGSVAVAALAVFAVAGRQRGREVVVARQLTACLLVPLIALFAYAWLAGAPIYVVGRVESPLLPFLVLVVAAGLRRLALPLSTLGTALLVVLSLPSLWTLLTVDTRSQERSIALGIARLRDPDEVVVTTRYHGCVAWYTGLDSKGLLVPYPLSRTGRFWVSHWEIEDPDAREKEEELTIGEVIHRSPRRPDARLWLVLGAEADHRHFAETLDARFALVGRWPLRYQGTEVRCYELSRWARDRWPGPHPRAGGD